MKIVKKNQLKIVIFTVVKNRCILDGRVFVMLSSFLDLQTNIHVHPMQVGKRNVSVFW